MASKTLSGKNSREGVPDILDAIAAMSSDAQPTPPSIARTLLDALPMSVWVNPDLKWLDPAVKSGSILREIAARLMDGLAEWEPDVEKRANHILRNMIYGVGITHLHAEMGRRSLYVSRDATGPNSLVKFTRPEGNLPFVPAEHDFPRTREGRVNGNCKICGAPLELERGPDRENHAYAFIHGAFPTEELKDMKFDVVVGNPPYQLKDKGAAASARPVYHEFIRNAIALDPRYVVMITPSRWFSGGKGLDEFRREMLADTRLKSIVDYIVEKDAFPGVNINGGVNYFLWDRAHDGPCEITTVAPGGVKGKPESRRLDEFDVFIRRNEAVSILRKVLSKSHDSFADRVSSRKPFGLPTDFHGAPGQSDEYDVKLFGSGRTTWVSREQLPVNAAWVDEWKVLVARATDGNENYPLPIWDHAGPFVASPGEACSETYLVASLARSEAEARRVIVYMRTKFFRFLVSLRKVTQDNKADVFRFVPELDLSRLWNDEALFDEFELDGTERAFIDEMIRDVEYADD